MACPSLSLKLEREAITMVIGNPILIGGGSGGGFTPADEGKVVSNGTLVSQGSQTITQNGTYDTTLISELIANISGDGEKNILGGTTVPSNSDGENGDIYIQYTDYGEFPSGYTPIEYISVGSTGGPYINTGFSLTPDSEYEIDCQYTDIPNNNSWLFGAYQSGKQTTFGYTGGNIYIQAGGNYASESLNLNRHVYKASHTQFLVDDIVKTGSPNWSNTVQSNVWLFHSNNDGNYKNNIKLYSCKIWDDDDLVRNFIPAIRDSDDEVGLYDFVNDVFYTNDGTGSFTAGNELTDTPIDRAYLKVNGIWGIIEDGDWSDVNTEGSSKNILSGTSSPSANQGNDGDLYLKYGLPSEYDTLDYIQGTGTQHLTIPHKPTTHTKAETKINIQDLTEGAVFGASWSISGFFLLCYNGGLRWHTASAVDSSNLTLNADYTVTVDNDGMDINGTSYASTPSTDPNGYWIAPFYVSNTVGYSSPTRGRLKMYYFKIYEDNALTNYLIPAKRKSDDEVGMYDVISGEFYTNAGTGTFQYGQVATDDNVYKVYLKNNGLWDDITGQDIDDVNTGGGATSETDDWTALDTYIESSGTQYIDTGYVANENTRFECVADVASPNSNWGTLFGSRIGQNNKAIFFGIYGNNREAWVTPWLSSATEITNVSHNLYNTKAVYLMSADSFGCYDLVNVVGGIQSAGSSYSDLSVYLFGLNTNGSVEVPCSVKLYRFRIYESDTLVHEFIPWIDSNEVVCLKDTVTGNLKYNAGTGTFTYGTDSE